ncbi:MAG: hydroxychlorobactene glucosyltransferase CruC [Acidobacteriaceae bacterium]
MQPILGLAEPEDEGSETTRAPLRGSVVEEDEATLELTVVVPARNEERNLPGCLQSLLAQTEEGFALGREWELIVVNDASTDGTRAIAEAAAAQHPPTEMGAAVTVMDAPVLDTGPRGGFTGKNNACWAGAQMARGRRILFTDADTVYEPGALSRSLREAERHSAALLSYSPRQIVTGVVQRAVMPLIFSELASVYPPAQVNDPGRRVAAANGQFLLVERRAYFDLGGHRAVGPSVLEDVALARNLKRAQRTIRFRYAPEVLSTRMYGTVAEMVEGWTKNLALLMPMPLYLAAWRVLDLVLFCGLPVVALGLPQLAGWQRGAILLLWVRTAFRFYSRVARSNFPAPDVAISVLGIPMFVFLLVRSSVRHRFQRSVTWKGRTYNPNRY